MNAHQVINGKNKVAYGKAVAYKFGAFSYTGHVQSLTDRGEYRVVCNERPIVHIVRKVVSL